MSGPQRYRKRPVVIEAVQWTGDNLAEVAALLQFEHVDEAGGRGWRDHDSDALLFVVRDEPISLMIRTVHGQPTPVRVGDWVIPEPVAGRGYPCKPGIFSATYEAVTE